ncbi:hypothetical protein KSP39_PZI011633 [Platanthera zijinensis]|uniref:Uncharacterized protein n=1 Tax=Platanthera zijinensis TaxID=2320716 RepID=A0AAP0G5R1_9ASPA
MASIQKPPFFSSFVGIQYVPASPSATLFVVKVSSERGGKWGAFTANNVADGEARTYWTPAKEEKKGGFWIELRGLNPRSKFNVVRIEEAIWMGKRIRRHMVYVDEHVVVRNGTTVGHKRLYRIRRPVAARRVRIRVLKSRGPPLLSALGLHFDPYG